MNAIDTCFKLKLFGIGSSTLDTGAQPKFKLVKQTLFIVKQSCRHPYMGTKS
jgi:hypothetical protein